MAFTVGDKVVRKGRKFGGEVVNILDHGEFKYGVSIPDTKSGVRYYAEDEIELAHV